MANPNHEIVTFLATVTDTLNQHRLEHPQAHLSDLISPENHLFATYILQSAQYGITPDELVHIMKNRFGLNRKPLPDA